MQESLFNLEGAIEAQPLWGYTPDREGGVAQMGEHLLCKQGVDSSNLFISTSYLEEGNERESSGQEYANREMGS